MRVRGQLRLETARGASATRESPEKRIDDVVAKSRSPPARAREVVGVCSCSLGLFS